MSDAKTETKKVTKRKNLGRGLNSLLGSPDFDEDSVTEDPAGSSTTSSWQARPDFKADQDSQLQEGILEQKTYASSHESEPTKEVKIPDNARIWEIDIEKLSPLPNQPRKHFAQEALRELATSIKQKGVIQPLIVKRAGSEEFQIIAGERRWRAAQQAGLHKVPVIIKDPDEQNSLELALIENIQRQDLNPIEEAEAYALLTSRYSLTQQELADRVGKERATVANLLRLQGLQADVKEWVKQGSLSLGQAKTLLSLQEQRDQKKAAQQVIKKNLTVRATERLVQKMKGLQASSREENPSETANTLIGELSTELQKLLGSRVKIDYRKGKGRLSIHFYSDDQLNQIVDRIKESWHN